MEALFQHLERLLSQRVELLLKDRRTLTGRLAGLDEHMNIVLEEVEERTETSTRRLGRVVLRGSNMISLTASGAPARNP